MNRSSGVEISPERLLSLVREAIEVHKGYNKESRFTFYDKWNWKKFRHVTTKLYDYPSWAYPHGGIMGRLWELKIIAESVHYKDRVFISELTFLNLILITQQSEKFQKDIFVMRY